MPSTIIVEVDDDYILAGFRSDCDRCPIALAIFDQLAGGWDVEVYAKRVRFAPVERPNDQPCWVDLPAAATNFVRFFDEVGNEAVQPLKFPLNVSQVPAEAFRAGVAV